MRFWGHCDLKTTSEVRSDHRFEIYGPNYKCYHVCLDWFSLSLNFLRRRKKMNLPLLELSASPQLKCVAKLNKRKSGLSYLKYDFEKDRPLVILSILWHFICPFVPPGTPGPGLNCSPATTFERLYINQSQGMTMGYTAPLLPRYTGWLWFCEKLLLKVSHTFRWPVARFCTCLGAQLITGISNINKSYSAITLYVPTWGVKRSDNFLPLQ